jgi:hypothetical protein
MDEYDLANAKTMSARLTIGIRTPSILIPVSNGAEQRKFVTGIFPGFTSPEVVFKLNVRVHFYICT